ncbi:DnaJ-class molecular chaperone [Rhizobium sp. BE258]|jgi:DnaJ-class molecular chaperone|nr:DnaJ-class molecular chaperone [Rhizobium sp. BE258]
MVAHPSLCKPFHARPDSPLVLRRKVLAGKVASTISYVTKVHGGILMANPYETLGVAKGASQKEIQTAYRKLAKKLHPDLNPGDAASEEKFKAASAAYAILGDEDKRAKFDRGEIDETGAGQQQRSYYRDYAADQASGARYHNAGGFADFGDRDDIFSSFFSGARSRGNASYQGGDLQYRLEVSLREAANGGKRTVSLPEGGTLELKIPAGVRDGQILRLRGKGAPGHNDGPAGDALIEIHVLPDRQFSLEGDDVRTEVPISIREAVLGAKVEVPTLSGAVFLSVPPNSSTGKTLRLKGKGFPNKHGGHGDQYVVLKIVLQGTPDAELNEFMTNWEAGKSHDPRRT